MSDIMYYIKTTKFLLNRKGETMKRFSGRIITAALMIALVTAMLIPAAVFADSIDVDEYPTLREMARQAKDRNRDPFGFVEEDKRLSLAAESFPEKYDLRDVDGERYVTPVRFQNPFGSCWGFAAIAAAESSLLGSGIAEEDGYDWSTLDLSEKHLINFVTMPISDPSHSQYGEGMHYADENMRLEEKFNHGGLPIFATSLFSSGRGPNLEDRKPSKFAPAGTPENIYEYHGLNSWTDKRKIDGKWVEYCYSADDDWSMPEELRFTQSYVLKESYMLPSPAKMLDPEDGEDDSIDIDNDAKYEYDPQGTSAIKDQLMHKRGVEIGYCSDTWMPGQDSDGKYISENWAHYTYTPDTPNHAVCIIGWDDNYPKENFLKDHQPPENGAWLVKNSWGSGEEEFPNKGPGKWGIPNEDGVGTGYFWLSYYDQSIDMVEALAFDESNVDREYYIDQYDFMPVSEVVTMDVEEDVRMANVFTAEVHEKLEQISCQTSVPGSKVQYEVYLLRHDYDSPVDGMAVASGEAQFEYGGFHKIRLDAPIDIQKGQPYSVVLTMMTPANEYSANMQMAYGKEMLEFVGSDNWTKGVVNPKESFIKSDGKWWDYSDPEYLKTLFEDYYQIMEFDNFPIKGYCKESKDLNLTSSVGTSAVLKLTGDGSQQNIRITFKGGKGVLPEATEIEWEQSEGSSGIFSFEADKEDSTLCRISAIKPGTGYLKASMEGVGSLVIRVDVSKYGVYETYEYTLEYGESGYVEVYDQSGAGVADTLTYKSDDPKIVKVSKGGLIKGTGIGKTVVRGTDKIGAEVEIKVKVVKADPKLKLKGKTAKVAYSKLKGGDVRLSYRKAVKVKCRNKKARFKFRKLSGDKKIKVDPKTGKITVKKGLKKGTYKVKVRMRTRKSKYYKQAVKTVTFRIRIK